MRSVVLVVGLVACKEDPGSSVYEPANLERATVTIAEQEDFEGTRRDWHGGLRIDGEGPDYTVVVSTTAGNENIEVHSSGRSDLTGLDGLEGVQVSIAPDPISDEMSLSIVDADGQLLYLLEPVEAGLLTVDHFGQGLVAVGEDLGEITVESFEVAFTSALFRTDTGDVELLPGEPQEVLLDGISYRVVLIASYTSVNNLAGDVRCTGAEARVAFELLRLDEGTADLSAIVRSEGAELPLSQCIAPTR